MKIALKENVDVQLELSKDVGMLLGDPVQIRQVFMNLAVNAGEAMPNGGKFKVITESVCVEADFAPGAVPGDYILVTVSDTGRGMDEDILAHAFDPFFSTKEEGSGLGLSLVNSIVSQHGGFIRASSVTDGGTTFRVFLPIADVLPGGEAEVTSIELLRAKSNETVLVVEDRDMCRLLTKTMLESLGYRVIEAEDGAQAIEKGYSCSDSIDVILTDVVMPGLSGPEMVLKLRDKGVEATTIYMSGYADGVLAEHGLTGTRMGILQKPFMLAQLAQAVRDAIAKG
jgi:CheY-like chemotaxis protein